MGCGQSKINLYPRRNKNGGKGNSAKKSGRLPSDLRLTRTNPSAIASLPIQSNEIPIPQEGHYRLTPDPPGEPQWDGVIIQSDEIPIPHEIGAAEKEADEEEGSAAAAAAGAPDDGVEDDPEKLKHLLPLTPHPPTFEISASQLDFFKMLDEKIEKGRDYDSSSETEINKEQERRKILIHQWRSASQSTQSSLCQSSPPTPARRRMPRPMMQPPDRQNSPASSRRCYRQQHIPDGMSPPPRRAHSAQSHHQPEQRQVNGGDRDWLGDDTNKSPVKRPQSAGSNWKNNPKVAPYNQKPKNTEANEHSRTHHKEYEHTGSSQDVSQITYNPTFQSHSPAHSVKSQQPYIAQIVTYPISQQVTPPSPPKYIAPPEEYQDPQNNIQDNKYPTPRQTPTTPNSQPIYYIHGNTNANVVQDIVQQRQQTAIHLQQYVAMKQAQQQMFSYLQRNPHTVFPNVDYSQIDPSKVYEQAEYTQYSQTTARPHSAPTPVGVVRPMAVPGYNPVDGSHMNQMPVWSPMPAVVSSMGPWVPGQMGQDPYYPQAQYMQTYRPNSAGSAGTLTRYKRSDDQQKNIVCQSINLVRQKPVGQIVVSGQDLTVCTNSSDSPSPASVSTDSGVSPGNSAPSSKTSMFPLTGSKDCSMLQNSTVDSKSKKKSAFGRSLKNSKSLDSS